MRVDNLSTKDNLEICPADSPSSQGSKLAIRIATDSDLPGIYQFRYKIYVEEMGRQQRYADHLKRRICDPLDDTSHVLGAWDQDQVVGTVRTNFFRDGDLGEYTDHYRLYQLPKTVQRRTAITTRLMIDPRFRKGTLGVRLSKEVYHFGLTRDISTDLIDCNPHLVPFFTRLGYRFRNDLNHPEYGSVKVMKLDLHDQAHLQSMGSPFLPNLKRWINANKRDYKSTTL